MKKSNSYSGVPGLFNFKVSFFNFMMITAIPTPTEFIMIIAGLTCEHDLNPFGERLDKQH